MRCVPPAAALPSDSTPARAAATAAGSSHGPRGADDLGRRNDLGSSYVEQEVMGGLLQEERRSDSSV